MLLVALLVFRALSGPAAVCAGGWRPARWPSAPRASLGASSFLRVLLVAPRVFRALSGPAARETRRRRFARRRVSKPARALRSLRRPPHQWGRVADWRVVSEPGRAPSPPHRCRVHTSLAALLSPHPISHAIPSDVFHGLKFDRWYSADSALAWGWAEVELHAKWWGLVSAIARELVHCLPFRCNALPG